MAIEIIPTEADSPKDLASLNVPYTFFDGGVQQDSIKIIRGNTFSGLPEKIRINLDGYNWRGDGSTTGLDEANCLAQLRGTLSGTEAVLATFQIKFEVPQYSTELPITSLFIDLCLPAEATAGLNISARNPVWDIQLVFFETDCGSPIIATPVTGKAAIIADVSRIV